MSVTELAQHLPPPIPHQSGDLPRRRFFNDMPDKGLFALAALAGFFVITVLKTRDFDPDIITILAVALMMFYGMIAYNIPAVNMRLDRLGDNFYYLGFIYTLASLSAAIIQLRGNANVDELIGSFGIALVTTIVGIAGRVLFVQMRTDLDEIEESTRRDLASTAAQLRAELFASIREFETVRTALVQTLKESTEAFAKASEHQLGRIESISQAAAKRIDEAFDPGRSGMKQVHDQMQSLARVVEQAAGRVASIEIPSERLNSQLAAFAASLELLIQRLGNSVEEAARRSSIPNERLNAALADFTKELDTSLRRLSEVADGSVRKSKTRRRWYWPF